MSVAAIRPQVEAFAAALAAARPFLRAPVRQRADVLRQGRDLLEAIDAAIAATGALLDGPDPTGHPLALIAAVRGIAAAADEHAALHDLRGFVGRAVFNLSRGYA